MSGERNNTNQESEREMNVAYVNNTGADLRINGMHKAIIKAIETTGQLPEEIADLLTLTKTDIVNPDGSPRYIVDWA